MKKLSHCLLLVLFFSIVSCGCSSTEVAPAPIPEPVPVVEDPVEDPIDSITVTGQAAERTDDPRLNKAQIKIGAGHAAKIVAYRNLFERIKGVQLDSETRVEDFVTSFDKIDAKSGGYLRMVGAVSKAEEIDEGMWEVTIELTSEEVAGLIDAINDVRNR